MIKKITLILIGLLLVVGTAQAVTFDNSGGTWQKWARFTFTSATTEYAQYKLVINGHTWELYNVTGTLKYSATVTDFWSLVQSDGDDIRVFNQSGQLYFWLESWDYTNQQATIWVKVEAGSTKLNIAYGNSLATKSSYNNPEMVFEFFDDFEGTSLDRNKWNLLKGTEGSNVFVQNGVLKVTSTTVNIESIQTFSEPVVLELKIKVVSYPNTGIIAGGFRASTTNNTELLIWAKGSRIYADGVIYPESRNFGYVFPTGEWGIIRFFSSGGQTRVTIERAGVIEFDKTVTTTTSSEKIHLTERPDPYAAGSGEWYWDWVRVLKLADPADVSSFSTGSIYSFYFKFVNETGEIIDPKDVEYVKFITLKLNKSYTLDASAVTHHTTSLDDEIRVEFKYTTSTDVISRDFDIRMLYDLGLEGKEIYIEIPTKLTQFHEQLIYSATSKPVIVKNVVTQAYLAAANTKYTYQDALMLPVYTVAGMYYLYTYDNGQLVMLGTIDGGRSVMINLDVIEASRKSYAINVLSDDISISKEFNNTLKIYYKNHKNDASEVNIKIYNTSNNEILFNHTETDSLNEFTLYFDYSTLNIDNDTLLKITVTVKDSNNNTRTIERLFNLNGESGQINPTIATFLAFSMSMFGLTLVSTRHAFGLLGIVVLIAALGIAALGVSVWYVKFTQAVILVLLVYTILVYRYENVEVN